MALKKKHNNRKLEKNEKQKKNDAFSISQLYGCYLSKLTQLSVKNF